ncbi:50S ribosomal protein L25/general stress protein Ctc [Novibacillus thermophilus]|uniref:Large ribosomal subunit protein bL25 n=1 Tax=Novibacillus thermophilus TaxID=1471761 RepID=A0A1U9K348_9BACL|nr:50S ribosomal protein L25/general stress protein Ctc [Novibacillus thermophilus]AQS54463.1 50S ribosomal protein L25/general stress protein Ctc [Novibacillus thermophilus]
MAITLQAEKRNKKPRSVLRRIRKAGKVPAVVYGKDLDNVTIAVDEVEMTKILREEGDYAVLELEVEGDQSYHVMVYDVQKDPIKDNLVHIDFKTIRMDEPVNSEVTIELTGEAAGVKEGGVLQQLLRALEIRSLPDQRPDVIQCDVTGLNIGDSLSVADLQVPEGVEVLNDADETVVSVVPPVKDEPVTAEDGNVEEPELVEKTKGDGESEDA